MAIKVLQLSHSDISGGAARAAYRIHHALRSEGVDSQMLVNVALSGDPTVLSPGNQWAAEFRRLRSKLIKPINGVLNTHGKTVYSFSLLPSRWPEYINKTDADIVNLHWVQGEMLSIYDLCRINKPIVWTLHDMWAFCGAEHYTTEERWRRGYQARNRPLYEPGVDLNRWIWKLKQMCWRKPLHIVCPSQWLSNCASQSVLMRDWPIRTVPNPIDPQSWQPLDQRLARDLLRLPQDVPLLLFGAIGGSKDPRKGFDLLLQSLNQLHLKHKNIGVELLVLGQLKPSSSEDFAYPVHYLGHLHDDLSLRALYSAADVVLIPSRQDNLPNVGLEAQICGTPVVAFNTCGLLDIISHRRTGYLATAYCPNDFAEGIVWGLTYAKNKQLAANIRAYASNKWLPEKIARAYIRIYNDLLSCH